MNGSDITAVAVRVGDEIVKTVEINPDPFQAVAYVVIIAVLDGVIKGGISNKPWLINGIQWLVKQGVNMAVNAWKNGKKGDK